MLPESSPARFASRNCDDWIQGRKNMMASGAKASFANSATMGAARGASLDTASCVDLGAPWGSTVKPGLVLVTAF